MPTSGAQEFDRGAASGLDEVQPHWLSVVSRRKSVGAVTAAILDEGEAAVIQLALDEGIRTVCIDERAGRRIARAIGCEVTGTLGLLLRAKRCGFVPAIAPVLERLRRGGAWYDAELVRRVLAAAGEG